MKKLILALVCSIFLMSSAASQTLHTIIMVNKEEPNREVDRTADFNKMTTFWKDIASSLGYRHNLKQYSGSAFTAANALTAIDNLLVSPNDIVVFYYSGHGANWDNDEWPHLSYKDRNYSQSAIYSKLKTKASNAKLILCIGDCCNMDSEGNRREKKTYATFDPILTKQLFTDFEGHRGYIISASIRGQYSYSDLKNGALFGIGLRQAVRDALSGEIKPNWIYVLEAAKNYTLEFTEDEQMPQYKMDRW